MDPESETAPRVNHAGRVMIAGAALMLSLLVFAVVVVASPKSSFGAPKGTVPDLSLAVTALAVGCFAYTLLRLPSARPLARATSLAISAAITLLGGLMLAIGGWGLRAMLSL